MNHTDNKDILMARKVASAVRAASGTTYYVGGCVRDRLLGKASKDIDIEVHGIYPSDLETILDSLGTRIAIGESFGIYNIKGYLLDIAMPRKEKNRGIGHNDFDICVDPFVGTFGAALRRDFTFNALLKDVLDGNIIDHFGGIADLKNGVIRHVNDLTFKEDPLRVLRAAQFASRFDFEVCGETVELCSKMDLSALPKERVFGELEKALLKSEKPSFFFETLREMDQLSVWFPEIKALIGIDQNPVYHPEGDVWIHTMQVLDMAAGMRDKAENPLWFMLSALCHDFGKIVTSKETNGVIHSYRHEKDGVPVVDKFLNRLTNESKLKKYVLDMTLFHMRPYSLVKDDAHVKSFMKMYDDSVSPRDLLLLAKADFFGRSVSRENMEALIEEYAPIETVLNRMLELYYERMSKPYLTGTDLLQAGFPPGELMGEALENAHKLRLAGRPKDEQLKAAMFSLKK